MGTDVAISLWISESSGKRLCGPGCGRMGRALPSCKPPPALRTLQAIPAAVPQGSPGATLLAGKDGELAELVLGGNLSPDSQAEAHACPEPVWVPLQLSPVSWLCFWLPAARQPDWGWLS